MGPPCHEGPILSLTDVRAVLARRIWAVNKAAEITGDGPFLRGQRIALGQLLEKVDEGAALSRAKGEKP